MEVVLLCTSHITEFFHSLCSYILDGREMPVLSMLEYIFYKIMHRLVSKQREAIEKWAGQRICPKIKKKLDKNTEFAANCHVSEASQQMFRVQSGKNSYTVDLGFAQM